MKKIITILLASVFLFPSASMADGNKMLNSCQLLVEGLDNNSNENLFAQGACLGYIMGYRDTMKIMSIEHPKYKFCVPSKLTNLQVARIVVNQLKNSPEKLDEMNIISVFRSLHNVYPCKK